MTSPAPPPANPPRWRPGPLELASYLVLALVAICPALRPLTADDDFWAHAATGRWILAHGQVPRSMLFLWSDHGFWLAHSWGSQVIFGLMLRCGEQIGGRIALWFGALMGLATMGLLLARWIKRSGPTVLIPMVAAPCIWLASDRFRPRPEMFSMLFFGLLLLAVESWTRPSQPAAGPGWRRCLFVFGLFLVWANLHGLVFVGLAFLLLAACGECVQRLWSRSAHPWEPLSWALCGVAAIFVNPYGSQLWGALGFLRSPPLHSNVRIVEFAPALADPGWGSLPILIVLLLPPLALAAWFLSPKKRLVPLLWGILATLLVFMARRHCATFASVMLIVFAASEFSGARVRAALASLFSDPGPQQSWLSPQVLLRLCGLGLGCFFLAFAGPQLLLGPTLSPDLPRPLCTFVENNLPPGRVFNDYNISSYLVWRLAPEYPLSFHLLNVSPTLPATFGHVLDSPTFAERYLSANRVNIVALQPWHTGNKPRLLLAMLASNQKVWAPVYAASDGTVWLRRTVATAALCDRLEVKTVPTGVAASLAKFGTQE